ncbi:MAG: TetR family transcriptional regulator, partial [Desulfobacterales bacterium]|nr:TetR family transcriptional regulator [Desulfobacterales bacterium]
MNIRQARKEQTVRNILDAAAREFSETGFEGARMDRIANRAGANKAMIYYHIGDKQVLYTNVLHEVLGHTAARMADNIQSAGTPRKKLKAYIRSIGQTVTEHPFMRRIMMREMASGGRALPDIVIDDFAAIIGMVSGVIQAGVHSGEFVEVDPFVLHLMVIGGLTYGRAAVPVMSRYPEQVAALTGANDIVNTPNLLDQIETIVLSA